MFNIMEGSVDNPFNIMDGSADSPLNSLLDIKKIKYIFF